jgi:hypothetical protein
VGGLLTLVGAPKKIRDMVSAGKVSASLAVSTLREQGESAVSVLETGLESAQSAGKTKLTARNLPKKVEKVGLVNIPVTKRNVIERGLAWIEDNGSMEHSYSLLSKITGKTIDELKKIKH